MFEALSPIEGRFVGRSGRHRQSSIPNLRTTLIVVAGIAVVAIVATTAVITTSGGSTRPVSAHEAHSTPTHHAPRRASRGGERTPLTKPTYHMKVALSVKQGPPSKPEVIASGTCEASFYGTGQMTASGEPFDPSELTAAHKTLPMGSTVKVTNRNNGESVVVRINDRGPFVAGRCLDLSTAAMKAVGGMGSGVIPVRYQVLAED